MDDHLEHVAATERGIFLRSEILAAGYDDRRIGRMLAAGRWRRVRHGAYCFSHTWAAATPEQQHLLRARAVVRTTPGMIAYSHVTALLALGVPVWGVDLDQVHVTRLDGGSYRQLPDVIHHLGAVGADDLIVLDGQFVTKPARAVIETAAISSVEAGVVAADGALHLGLCDQREIFHTYAACGKWPGSQRLHLVVRHMDGLSASPGESRAKFQFWAMGLPLPQLQFPVYDEAGALVATTDFGWPEHGVLGEFDGRVKYGRLLRPGERPEDALFREKRREDQVRELTGFRFFRVVWSDLSHPDETRVRAQRLFNRAA